MLVFFGPFDVFGWLWTGETGVRTPYKKKGVLYTLELESSELSLFHVLERPILTWAWK